MINNHCFQDYLSTLESPYTSDCVPIDDQFYGKAMLSLFQYLTSSWTMTDRYSKNFWYALSSMN